MDLSSEPGLVVFLGRWGLGGLAAGFASGGWVGRRLSEVTAEDLADLGVPRLVRGEVLAALRAAVAEELAATLDGWMTPLAHAASGYLREEHPRLRLWSACDVAEMALRLIVIIGLAQVRRAHGGRLPRERLVRVFEHIRTPTLSHWRAMALETCKALEEDGTAECRELGALLAPVARVLSDLVGHGGDTETASLLRLRNMLAHGSVSTSLARDLAERWRTRIDDVLGKIEPLARLPLLARASDGKVLRASGEAGTVAVVPEINPAAVGMRAGAAAIGLADRVLPLAPFVLRGVPRVGEVRGSREVPQIFLRRSEIVLEYMALGAEDAAFGQGDDEHLQDFERLFETPRAASERRFQIPGFERELRRDADQFLGRAGELEALWNCATGPEQVGLYWLYGPPGIGKSILMARLMADLIDEAEERRARGTDQPWLVLAYRFRTGHESCRSSTFLGFLRERLSEVVTDPETGTATRGLDDLQAVAKLLPLAAKQARVLVPLDGLDEIAAAEPNFLSLDLAGLVDAGGLWLGAGRPEGRLPEFMRRHGAREVLPGGLGGMETAAIRAMILEKAGPLGRKLLAGDRDGGDGQGVVNAFVEAVARKADGLPLYVRYVIGDILGNRLRFLDGREAEGLPPSLTAYYEELVQRCAVGDDHVLATYALCLLALAYETLSEAAIADLLSRRLTLDGDAEAQRARVRAALGRLGGMLTRGFTPEGEIGFRIYHESLREHLQNAPDLAITRRDTTDNILCKGAREPGQGPASRYLYRAGVTHLVENDGSVTAEALLLDPSWFENRAFASLDNLFDAARDLENVLANIPSGSSHIRLELVNEAFRADLSFLSKTFRKYPAGLAQSILNYLSPMVSACKREPDRPVVSPAMAEDLQVLVHVWDQHVHETSRSWIETQGMDRDRVILGPFLWESRMPDRAPERIEFSPSGDLIVTAAGWPYSNRPSPPAPWPQAYDIYLWRAADGKLVRRLLPDERSVPLTDPPENIPRLPSMEQQFRDYFAYRKRQRENPPVPPKPLYNFELPEPQVEKFDPAKGTFGRLIGQGWLDALLAGDVLAVCWLNEEFLLASCRGGRIFAFDVGSGSQTALLQDSNVADDEHLYEWGDVGTLSLERVNDTSAIVGSRSSVIRIVNFKPEPDVVSSARIDPMNGFYASSNRVHSIASHQTSGLIAIGLRDYTIQILDCSSLGELHRLIGHTDAVSGVAWSPCGRRLASISWDKTLRVWNLDTGQEMFPSIEHPMDMMSLKWGPSDDQILTSWNINGVGGSLRVWSAATGKLVFEFGTCSALIRAMAISQNTGRIAVGCTDGSLRAFRSETSGARLAPSSYHSAPIRRGGFCARRNELATISLDGVLIWLMATDDPVRTYKCDWNEYIHWTFDIKYSPDGKYIAAVVGHIVNMFESNTLDLLWSRSSSNHDISACRFSSDGTRFLTDDGKAPNLQFVDRGAGSVVWDVATGRVIDRSGDSGTEADERLREYERAVVADGYASKLSSPRDPRLGEEWTSSMREDGNSGLTEVTLWDADKHARTFWLPGVVSSRFQLPSFGEWFLIFKGGKAPIRAKVAWP